MADKSDGLASDVLRRIVCSRDYDYAEVMVVLESLVLGAVLFYEKKDGIPRGGTLDVLYDGVVARLQDLKEVN